MTDPLLIDFDHTICNMRDVVPGYKMGTPMPGALEAITELVKTRKCIVFTVRAQTMQGTKAVMQWLDYFKFPPMAVTAIKQNGDILDDRAIRFTDWKQAMEVLGG